VNDRLLTLLIHSAGTDEGAIRRALAHRRISLKLSERLSTALALISEGGVDIVLLDASASNAHDDLLDRLLPLRLTAPLLPIVVVGDKADDDLAFSAKRAGAAGYLIRDRLEDELPGLLDSIVEPAHNGHIIAFVGAKGGVGATTIALNVASALARRSTAILVEMRPTLGTLTAHLRPHDLVRNLSHCLKGPSYEAGSGEVGASLWNDKKAPGLSILFGPQTVDECGEIGPEQATGIIQSLAPLADYVIVDLPPSLSPANRAVIEHSGSITLVVERDPVCVQLGKTIARSVESWRSAPRPIGAIVSNRGARGSWMPMTEIDAQLGCHMLGAIPLAADLCLNAQRASAPLVALYPDSLFARVLNGLSEKLAPAARLRDDVRAFRRPVIAPLSNGPGQPPHRATTNHVNSLRANPL